MNSLWFMLTLMLDTFPFVMISVILLRKQLLCPLSVAIAKTSAAFLLYNSLICYTYMHGMYGAGVMVVLRVLSLFLAIFVIYGLFQKYYLQFVYKAFLAVPYMLLILEIAAFCINYINTDGLPQFMPITCLRFVILCFLGYPYYLMEKKILIPNFEVENKQIWGMLIVSQLILDMAMFTTIRTDYAVNGIDLRGFALHISMVFASMCVGLLMFYIFNMARRMEIISENQKRDELLIEINRKQYVAINSNIEAMRHVRHDIKHHIRVIDQLLSEGKHDELRDYLKQYDATIPETKIKFCENLLINALFEYYYGLSTDRGIDVSFDCAELGDCTIDDIDLNVLLGNAIENAMEGCLSIEENKRKIVVCAKKMAGHMFITVDNTFDGMIRKTEGKFLSKKRGFDVNGYGNASMDAVALKYHGSIKREVQDNRYLVSIVLSEPDYG